MIISPVLLYQVTANVQFDFEHMDNIADVVANRYLEVVAEGSLYDKFIEIM